MGMSAKNTSSDSATLWVIVPFVVAVIGTVVMLFTNSANAVSYTHLTLPTNREV